MASFLAEFKHLELQLEDIILATNSFDERKVIGGGGFGKVYAGELSLSQSGEKILVAIKRLDRKYGQGDPEFLKEISTLSGRRHDNLISLLGFCSQGGEMILVYEYASRGSLDHLLSSAALTWTQRLRICLDAAKGLSFLHDPNGTQQRVLHCDIKSANILLDKNMTAKVSDFGLSKMGPANQQYSLLITSAVGTPGYCDPLYMKTYSLTKESDVYSFGVLMFEVMCGRLCAENRNGRLSIYVPSWIKSYEENKLDEIIMQDLRKQMDPSSMKTFSDTAYQCLHNAREKRPTMSRVVEELEIALESQEFPDLRLEMLRKHEDILTAVDPLLAYVYKTGIQLKELLSKGVFINEGKTWLSITEKGDHIERIYIEACLITYLASRLNHLPNYIVNSRFPGGQCFNYPYSWVYFKARVRGQYLTPQISYTVNLVFQYYLVTDYYTYNHLRYNIEGEDETKVLLIYPSIHEKEDGWFVAPLYQFTSQHNTADLQFEFQGLADGTRVEVAGIEFQPSEEKVELQVFEEYQHIVEAVSQSLFYSSLDELKQILSQGVHLNGYKTWFALNTKGEHCHMISIKDCLVPKEDFPSTYKSRCWSRFPAGLFQTNNMGFKTHVKTQFLSPLVAYSVSLVIERISYVGLKYRLKGETTTSIVYLPYERDGVDDCNFVELFHFTSDGKSIDLEITFEDHGSNLEVEGILFRPLKIVEDPLLKDDKEEHIQAKSESGILEFSNGTAQEAKSESGLLELLNNTKKKARILHATLGKWFQFSNEWHYFDKNKKKCVMLSARVSCFTMEGHCTWRFLLDSRFGKVLVITAGYNFELVIERTPEMLSLDITYAVYFIYKLPSDRSNFEFPLRVNYGGGKTYFYLVSPPNTPVIGQKLNEKSYYNPLNRRNESYLPRQRSDGWMEAIAFEFYSSRARGTESMRLMLEHPVKKDLSGLIVHGIKLRPV